MQFNPNPSRTIRQSPPYALRSSRDEDTTQAVTSSHGSGRVNIWSQSSGTNRAASTMAGATSVQSQPRVSSAEDPFLQGTIPDSAPVASTSGIARDTSGPGRIPNPWTSAESSSANLRTAGSPQPTRTRDAANQGQRFGPPLTESLPLSSPFGNEENRRLFFSVNSQATMGHHRSQDSWDVAFRGLSDGSSTDPNLPPSRGTNGSSPATRESVGITGGHTPNGSIGMPRPGVTNASPYAPGSSHAAPPSRSFDLTGWRGQQNDVNHVLGAMGGLSIDGQAVSNGNGNGYNHVPQTVNGGTSAQGWPSSRSSPFLADWASLNGVQATAQGVSQYGTSGRSSALGQDTPPFGTGAAQYTSSQGNLSQGPSPNDMVVRSLANGQGPFIHVNQAGPGNQPGHPWYANTHPYLPPQLAAAALYANPYATGPQQYQSAASAHLRVGMPLAGPGAGSRDSGAVMRSPLLQQYLSSRYNKWELKVCGSLSPSASSKTRHIY